jgi:hypothetical protein
MKVSFAKVSENYDLRYNQDEIAHKDLVVGKSITLPILKFAANFCEGSHTRFSKKSVVIGANLLANAARFILGPIEVITRIAIAIITSPGLFFGKKTSLHFLQTAIYNFMYVTKFENNHKFRFSNTQNTNSDI